MKIIRRLTHALTALVFCISLTLPAGIVHAGTGGSTTKTWSGGGDGTSFSDPLNWVNGVAPVTGDSLVFDGDTASLAYVTLTDDLPDGTVIDSITIQGSNASITFNYTNNVVLGSTLSVSGTDMGQLYEYTAGKTITLGANLAITGSFSIAGPVDTAGYSITYNGGSSQLDGPISGAGGISLTGGSFLDIRGGGGAGTTWGTTSSFTGVVTVGSGSQLSIYSADALGATAGKTVIQPGGGLIVYDGSDSGGGTTYQYQTLAEPIDIGGAGVSGSTDPTDSFDANPAALRVMKGDLNNGVTHPDYGATGFTFSGAVNLTADTNFKAEADYFGQTITFDTLSLNGHALNQLNGSAAQIAYGGSTYPLPPRLVYSVSAGAGSSSGWEILPRDSLSFEGSPDGTGGMSNDVKVDRGGTFTGANDFGNVTAEDLATISPGTSSAPACMTYTGLNLSGALNEEMQGKTTACTDFSQITVNGTVTLGSTATLNLNLLASYVPQVGDSFEVISNDGTDPVSGTFNGLPEGATFGDASNSYNFTISYVGGDGNDVVVTRAAGAPNTGFKSHRVQLLAGYGAVALVAGAVFVGSRKVLRKTSRG